MDDQRLEIRISKELLAHVERARGELSRSAFVKAAVRRHVALLNSPDVAKLVQVVGESVPPVSSGAPPRVYPSPTAREIQAMRNIAEQSGVPEPVPPLFKCPVVGCPRRFGSAAAKCPEHGRTVMPA